MVDDFEHEKELRPLKKKKHTKSIGSQKNHKSKFEALPQVSALSILTSLLDNY